MDIHSQCPGSYRVHQAVSSNRKDALHVFDSYSSSNTNNLLALAVGLGGVVALVDNQILGAVVLLAGEVAGQDGLCAVGVALLGIERGARHVGDHGVAAAEGVLGGAQGVVLGGRLGEPDVAAVAGEVAGLEGGGDVLLDDDGAAGGVDEVGA